MKHDFVIPDFEETTPPQSIRVTPFEDGPVTILEEVLDLANHRRLCEFRGEHFSYGAPANDRVPDDLVVRRIFAITVRNGIRIRAVETCNPSFHYLARLHDYSVSMIKINKYLESEQKLPALTSANLSQTFREVHIGI